MTIWLCTQLLCIHTLMVKTYDCKYRFIFSSGVYGAQCGVWCVVCGVRCAVCAVLACGVHLGAANGSER